MILRKMLCVLATMYYWLPDRFKFDLKNLRRIFFLWTWPLEGQGFITTIKKSHFDKVIFQSSGELWQWDCTRLHNSWVLQLGIVSYKKLSALSRYDCFFRAQHADLQKNMEITKKIDFFWSHISKHSGALLAKLGMTAL